MKETVKEQWIEALRSGKYRQGKHVLRDKEDKFCCLGVLCDLYRKETGHGDWGESLDNYVFGSGSDNTRSSFLTEEVADWAGLENLRPVIDGTKITHYNDGHMPNIEPHDFDEIADLIEQHL